MGKRQVVGVFCIAEANIPEFNGTIRYGKPVSYTHLDVYKRQLYVFGRRFYAIYIAPEKKFEQSSFAGLSQRYTFLKNSFIVCVNGKEDRGYYNRLFDIWETPDAFYLYANARQAYIVSKAGFEQGTAEALAAHLRGRVEAKKYKTVKR